MNKYLLLDTTTYESLGYKALHDVLMETGFEIVECLSDYIVY